MVSLTLILCSALPALAGPNGDCTCRSPGGDVVEGQTACLKTSKGFMLARCEMVLNNTSWKLLDQPCPTADVSPINPDAEKLLLTLPNQSG
ncbi:MAG: hypothetical protein R3D32_09895 [Nitratireductor sp.]